MSNFSGLGIAIRGMQANQTALEVTSHNISNVNTKGYTRQEAVFQTGIPTQGTLSNVQIGSGVIVTDVKRVTDIYLEQRIQNQNAHFSYWDSTSNILHKVEGDIVSFDLPEKINSFFSSWHELSLNPETDDAKYLVQQKGEALVDTVNTIRGHMESIQKEVDDTMANQENEANLLIGQINDLNKEISFHMQRGNTPNDLLDKRKKLLQDLVGITGATVTYKNDETITVELDGTQLIGNESETLANEITWDSVAEYSSIGGLIAAKEKGDSYINMLDKFASNLISTINGVYGSFFAGNNASDLSLSIDVENATNISSEHALDIYNLMSKPLNDPDPSNEPDLSGKTLNQAVSSLLTKIGSETKISDIQKTTNEDMLIEMENNLASVSGVSLDEELSKMIQFQRAYEASAKMLSVIDEMLATLIDSVR